MEFAEWWKIYKHNSWSTLFSHNDTMEIARDAWDASAKQTPAPQAEQGKDALNKEPAMGIRPPQLEEACEYCGGRGEVTGFPKNQPCPNGCNQPVEQEPIPDFAMAIIRDLVEQYRNDEAHDQSTPIWPIVDRAEKLLKRWQGRKE